MLLVVAILFVFAVGLAQNIKIYQIRGIRYLPTQRGKFRVALSPPRLASPEIVCFDIIDHPGQTVGFVGNGEAERSPVYFTATVYGFPPCVIISTAHS